MVQKTKKRKKKSKAKIEKCNSEDSSIIFELDVEGSQQLENNRDISSPPPASHSQSPVSTSEQIEIQLTDDLADCLVNPPTDPEISEEETNTCDQADDEREILPDDDNDIKTDNTNDTLLAVTLSTPLAEAEDNEDIEVKQLTEQFDSPPVNTSEPAENEDKTMQNVETEQTPVEVVAVASPVVKLNKGAKNERKSKNKKNKKDQKLVLNPDEKEKEPLREVQEPKPAPLMEAIVPEKKTYSSVIKSSLPQAPRETVVEEAVVSNNKPANNKKEKKPREEKKRVTIIERSDSWENIPESMTKQEDSWEKTSKRSKKRNKNKTETDASEKAFNTIKEEIEPVKAVIEKRKEKQTTPELAPKTETTSIEEKTEAVAADTVEDTEVEAEKKKIKRRKKKQDSGEPEDLINVHKVLICDEQVRIQFILLFQSKYCLRTLVNICS